MRNLKLITASVLAILVAVLVVQNTEPVDTHLPFATVAMPHAVLIFGSLAAMIIREATISSQAAGKWCA
jgi:uncharacterized integral membrane protein